MYAPGTRRHIKAALDLGATPQEIMEVLKLCVVQGVQACNLCLTKSSASERSTSDKQLDRGKLRSRDKKELLFQHKMEPWPKH
jgi:hypothetical protein